MKNFVFLQKFTHSNIISYTDLSWVRHTVRWDWRMYLLSSSDSQTYCAARPVFNAKTTA